MPKAGAKVVVVMPARAAGRQLAAALPAIPSAWVDELLLADDGAASTRTLAARLPAVRLVARPHDAGDGGNHKLLLIHALEAGADVVVSLRPDGPFDPRLIASLAEPVAGGAADLVLGAPERPAPADRLAARVAAALAHAPLPRTGFRACSRRLLTEVPWLRAAGGAGFDAELAVLAAHFGFRVRAVPARAGAPARGGVAAAPVAAARVALHRRGLRRSERYEP
jgi:hypothetical protein